MPWIDPTLQPVLAVAAAVLTEDGTLIEANAGFLRIVEMPASLAIGALMAQFFIQPDFATIVRTQQGNDEEIYSGLITIGEYTGRTRTFRARIWRSNKQLRLMAEYDIVELEWLADKVLDLNRDYSTAQRDLVQTNIKLQQREAQILASSLTDSLTGVGNRRLLEQALLENSRADNKGEKLCVLMADLDHFKRVNDTYGHGAGDNVLAAFGKLLGRHTRKTDVVARFGGEEFVILMLNTGLAQAVSIADRIRGELAGQLVEPLASPITASFGVVERKAGEEWDALLSRADKALYEAKKSGRNRVVGG